MSEDRGHSLLAGAKITLGGLNITAREFASYRPEEVAYIVMRYMIQNADGNLYIGSVPGVLHKLWPYDAENITESYQKKIYRFMKKYGFRHYINNMGDHCWKVSIDAIDRGYRENIPVEKIVRPVIYRCQNCSEGPWDSHAKFVAHHEEAHKEKELTAPKVEEAPREYICSICGAKFINSHAYGGHMNRHYIDEGVARPEPTPPVDGVPCKKCGKLVLASGMGGHMQQHRMSPKMKQLYDVIAQYEGLTPREYAALMDGWSRVRVTDIASRLKDRGKIKAVGRRAAARYYLVRRRKAKTETKPMQPEVKAEPKAEKKLEIVPEPQAIAELPGRITQVLGAENIFQTNDGETWILSEGTLYRVVLEKVAGR